MPQSSCAKCNHPLGQSQKFCAKCGATQKVTTTGNTVRVSQGGGRAVTIQRRADDDVALITIEKPSQWLATLSTASQATFEGIASTHWDKVENSEELKAKLQANGARVQQTVAGLHRNSLCASNPGIMMEGLFLPGEELVIPIFESLSYDTVNIVAYPAGKKVDSFDKGRWQFAYGTALGYGDVQRQAVQCV
jgi:hypothetical protein